MPILKAIEIHDFSTFHGLQLVKLFSINQLESTKSKNISNNPDSLITITNLDSKMTPKLQLNQNHFDA